MFKLRLSFGLLLNTQLLKLIIPHHLQIRIIGRLVRLPDRDHQIIRSPIRHLSARRHEKLMWLVIRFQGHLHLLGRIEFGDLFFLLLCLVDFGSVYDIVVGVDLCEGVFEGVLVVDVGDFVQLAAQALTFLYCAFSWGGIFRLVFEPLFFLLLESFSTLIHEILISISLLKPTLDIKLKINIILRIPLNDNLNRLLPLRSLQQHNKNSPTHLQQRPRFKHNLPNRIAQKRPNRPNIKIIRIATRDVLRERVRRVAEHCHYC